MFVRVGIAVTCSIAAFTLNQLKTKREDKDAVSGQLTLKREDLFLEDFLRE